MHNELAAQECSVLYRDSTGKHGVKHNIPSENQGMNKPLSQAPHSFGLAISWIPLLLEYQTDEGFW